MALNSKTLAAILDDDDDLLLLDTVQSQKYPSILQLEDISYTQCKHLFRFDKEGLNDLRCMMEIPQVFRCNNRTVCSWIEGLCVVIWRLAYPNRLDDLSPLIGRRKFELSNISNTSLDYVHENYSHLLDTLNRHWLSLDQLQVMSTAIKNKNSPLENCWGFIDGTMRPICRPAHHQNCL